MSRHFDAGLWRIFLGLDFRLIEEIDLFGIRVAEKPFCLLRAGTVNHFLQLGSLCLEHLIFRS